MEIHSKPKSIQINAVGFWKGIKRGYHAISPAGRAGFCAFNSKIQQIILIIPPPLATIDHDLMLLLLLALVLGNRIQKIFQLVLGDFLA